MAASQTAGDGLARRSIGLPTAIGTTFSLITAGGVLATVGQGFFAVLNLLGPFHDDQGDKDLDGS